MSCTTGGEGELDAMSISRVIASGFLLALPFIGAMCASAHPVEVGMKVRLCEETHSICTWYKALISPPPGWKEDTTYGDQNLVTVFVPKDSREREFIYVNDAE